MKPELFFDQTAAAYRAALDRKRGFRYHFHQERMHAAHRAAALRDAHRVLDVGAGTGALYDFLQEHGPKVTYFACDPAPNMLAQSSIPEAFRQVGTAEELPQAWEQFDRIFLLGVSTYLSPAQLQRTLSSLRPRLRSGGQIIITFTHAGWWGLPVRNVLTKYFPRAWFPARLLGKSLSTYAHTPESLQAEFGGGEWIFSKPQWLNLSVPLKRFFPGFAFGVSPWLRAWLPAYLQVRMSSDFLLVLQA